MNRKDEYVNRRENMGIPSENTVIPRENIWYCWEETGIARESIWYWREDSGKFVNKKTEKLSNNKAVRYMYNAKMYIL